MESQSSTHDEYTNGHISEVPDKKSYELLNTHSEEIKEIIGRPPHWLVRSGIGVFFGFLSLIFLTASVIKYPEIIEAQLSLSAINAPKTIESKLNGKIVKLFFGNKSRVDQGEVIGWLESTSDHARVLTLSDEVDRIHTWVISDDLTQIRANEMGMYDKLGELQADFQVFEQSYREYLGYLPGGYYYERRAILEQEYTYSDSLLARGAKTHSAE